MGVVTLAGLAAFGLTGFWWPAGLLATRHQYGVLRVSRPYWYFVLADLSAWALALGPAMAVALVRLTGWPGGPRWWTAIRTTSRPRSGPAGLRWPGRGAGGRPERDVGGRGGAHLAAVRRLGAAGRRRPGRATGPPVAGAAGRVGRRARGPGDHAVVSVRSDSGHRPRHRWPRPMRVLVTGGAGFIGSAVVDALVADGDEVVVVDCLLPGAHRRRPTTSTRTPSTGSRTWPIPRPRPQAVAGVDAVCHQAAMVGLGVDFGDVIAYVDHNDRATAVLLDALHRRRFAGRLVLASSMVVYGEGRYRCAEHGQVATRPALGRRPRRRAASSRAARVRPEPRTRPGARDGRARSAQRVRRHQAPPGAPVRGLRPRARRAPPSPCATTTCTGPGCHATPPTPGWPASSAAPWNEARRRRCSRTAASGATSSTSTTWPAPTWPPSGRPVRRLGRGVQRVQRAAAHHRRSGLGPVAVRARRVTRARGGGRLPAGRRAPRVRLARPSGPGAGLRRPRSTSRPAWPTSPPRRCASERPRGQVRSARPAGGACRPPPAACRPRCR